jgi:DNA-binding PadR family transcriptional regulator
MRAAKMFSAHDLQLIILALTYLEETGLAMSEMEGSKRRFRITHAGAGYLATHRAIAHEWIAQLARPGVRVS